MQVGIAEVLNVLQTVAILVTLFFSVWQWTKIRNTIKVDNYSKIISALNDLRKERLAKPDLERALFKSREGWTDEQIRKRIYGVMLANILELALFSRDSGLMEDKHWENWTSIWKNVILPDESFAELMLDKTIYTFNPDAHTLATAWVKEIREQRVKVSGK